MPSGRSLSHLKIKQQTLCANVSGTNQTNHGTAPDGCGRCQFLTHNQALACSQVSTAAFRRQRTSANPNWHTTSNRYTHSTCNPSPLFLWRVHSLRQMWLVCCRSDQQGTQNVCNGRCSPMASAQKRRLFNGEFLVEPRKHSPEVLHLSQTPHTP